jgi:hypothetical protein
MRRRFPWQLLLGFVIANAFARVSRTRRNPRRKRARARPLQVKHPLAWGHTWSRPMHIDEASLDPLTAARMTDHNVRGRFNRS